MEEKKKERKREIRKHSSLKHFSAVSCPGSLALFLYSSVSLSLHGFLHHLSGLLSVSPSLCPQIFRIYYHCSPLKVFLCLSFQLCPLLLLCFSSSLFCLSLSLLISISLSLCLPTLPPVFPFLILHLYLSHLCDFLSLCPSLRFLPWA